MGHWATTSYVVAGFAGKLLGGDPETTSTEKLEFPKWMSFFREPVLLMGIGVFLVCLLYTSLQLKILPNCRFLVLSF